MEKSAIEIAYYEKYNRDYNQDIRNLYDKSDAIKFIPFFRMSEDIAHLDDDKMVEVILIMAQLHRDTYTRD
jgi:hypothetical protein